MSKYDDRGFLVCKQAHGPAVLEDRYLVNLKVKFDPSTGSTEPDESDLVDLEELIQSYKDQCGMEAALKAIKTGMKTIDDFKDDGKHSGEVPRELETAQGRANAALDAQAKTAALADKLGVPLNAKLTEDQLTAIISKTINEKYPDMIKKEEVKTNE